LRQPGDFADTQDLKSTVTDEKEERLARKSSCDNYSDNDDTDVIDRKVEAKNVCQQETSPTEIVAIDLKELSEDDLRHRVLDMNITREDILSINKMLKMDNSGHYARYREGGYFDIFNGEDDVRERVSVAVLLLQISPQLRSLRFKMVPARLLERNFWIAAFCLLEEGRPSFKKVTAATVKYKAEEKSTGTSVIELLCLQEHNPQQENLEIIQLREKVALAQRALEKMKLEMVTLEKVDPKPTAGVASTSTKKSHSGKWIIDKNSQEFISLDDDVKKQLRENKTKRMAEVMEQMKFILDTDDLSSSYGRWECCGKNVYQVDGCI